jgi:hypothetical protein
MALIHSQSKAKVLAGVYFGKFAGACAAVHADRLKKWAWL